MVVKEPPKPSLIMATPINVEESRAKRHQRQQSRFRDRGGIFVPSSRNTLADILLGKVSPLKRSHRRSVSASPTKRNTHTQNAGAQDLVLTARRVSSRKSSPRKRIHESSMPEAHDRNAKPPVSPLKGTKGPKRLRKSQANNSSESKSVPKNQSQNSEAVIAVPSSTKEPLQSIFYNALEAPKAAPVSDFNSRGRPAKGNATSIKKSRDSAGPSKPKRKGRAGDPATRVPGHAETGTHGHASVPSHDNSSYTAAAGANPSSRRRKSTLYSDGHSEDEYVPKQVKTTQGKAQGTISNKKASKRPIKTLSTRTKPGTSELTDIPEEGEEEISSKGNHKKQISTYDQQDALSTKKSSKRSSQEAEVEEERHQRPKKRIKESRKEVRRIRSDESQPPKKTSRKRVQNASTTGEADGEPRKRRSKVAKHAETIALPNDKVLTKQAKAKIVGSIEGDGKPFSRNLKDVSENISLPELAKPPTSGPLRRRPPKRVLQRIKECQHHDVDNEPDPIDFLS